MNFGTTVAQTPHLEPNLDRNIVDVMLLLLLLPPVWTVWGVVNGPSKLWVSQNFSQISRVSQSRFLAVMCVSQSRFLYERVSHSKRFEVSVSQSKKRKCLGLAKKNAKSRTYHSLPLVCGAVYSFSVFPPLPPSMASVVGRYSPPAPVVCWKRLFLKTCQFVFFPF